jgi:prepilin-type N-terminal cleavage/methylation domain-containing protein
MSLRQHPRYRSGFTLVEMLVVIMIIAMLMAITTFAIWKVILNAKQAKIAIEIDQLEQAMTGYKQTRMQYPPCMGTISLTNRKREFMRHITLAYTNSAYGTTEGNFDTLRNSIMNTWQYRYVNAGGSVVGLDLHNLDQAETLVFWLAGFPTPVNASGIPIANRRYFGFHRDEDSPFKRDVGFEAGEPLRYRTEPQFDFDEPRLIDIDGDGWMEYAPLQQRSGETNAPYVYFDFYTYGSSTNQPNKWLHYGYPRPDNNGANSTTARDIAEKFGIAPALATLIDPSRSQPVRWANATGVQIFCGGLDGKYGAGIPNGTDLKTVQRAITFPQGQTYGSGDNYGSSRGLDREDLDDLTNLSKRTIDDARTEAGQ